MPIIPNYSKIGSDKLKLSIGVISGIIIGSIAFLIVLCYSIYRFIKRRKSSDEYSVQQRKTKEKRKAVNEDLLK